MAQVKHIKSKKAYSIIKLNDTQGHTIEVNLEITVISRTIATGGKMSLAMQYKINEVDGNTSYFNKNIIVDRAVRDFTLNAFPKATNSDEDDLHMYQAILQDYNATGAPFNLAIKDNFELVMEA